jgi:hypothetical protein
MTGPTRSLLGALVADPGPWAYAGTTVQLAGLFPFGAGSGAPAVGVPVGRHLTSHEVVCCDPFAWHEAGLVTNLGMMVLGAPGVGKTSLAKRIIRGLMACGVSALVLGDPKGEYVRITRSAGGQVIRVGRGLDRINPLDAGPLGLALDRMTGPARDAMLAEVRGQRLNTLLALCALVRRDSLADWEAAVLGAAIDLLTGIPRDRYAPQPVAPQTLAPEAVPVSGAARSVAAQHLGRRSAVGTDGGQPTSGAPCPTGTAGQPPVSSSGFRGTPLAGPPIDPTIPDVLTVLAQGPSKLADAAQVPPDRFHAETTPLRRTLYGLVEGPLKGVFDGPTSTPLDLNAPAVCVDLSAITGAGDTLMAAAMLATWSYGHAMIEASHALTAPTSPHPDGSSPSWTRCGAPCAARPRSSSRPTPSPGSTGTSPSHT